MDFSEDKIRKSLIRLNETVKSSEISQILKTKEFSSQHIDEIIDLLCTVLIKCPGHAIETRIYFSSLLLPIVSKLFNEPNLDFNCFQRKCIAVSMLAETNQQVLRFTIQHFTIDKTAPFVKPESDDTPKKKSRKTNEVTSLEIVEMCLRFLRLDRSFFRRIWNWEAFIEIYHNLGCDFQKFYCNQIIALLFGMTSSQLSKLNQNIPKDTTVQTELNKMAESEEPANESVDKKTSEWNLRSNIITGIEGVFLPIFDKLNFQFYNEHLLTVEPRTETRPSMKGKIKERMTNQQMDKLNNIVRVDSTRINLRSLALGISSGKAICLTGPVGCGKTSLVEYLARKTGRLAPTIEDFMKFMNLKQQKEKLTTAKGKKRKLRSSENDDFKIQECVRKYAPQNGFLRIQLGDQTDSKVLLGQYRCTDIPGEFIWQPGMLTQAVLNGYWLLLEDLDAATQDVCTVLSNLLENDFLNVPGFRENLKIAPGFQLFITLRTQKSSSVSAHSSFSLMEKHLYTINIIPISRDELSEIICQNYPNLETTLETVSKKIVDVFLKFSSGCHATVTENVETDALTTSSKKKKKTPNDEIVPYAQHMLSTTNSGRMVSTRDLLKLCKRSNPNFEVASSECADILFKNCVDLFCSHLPSGPIKTDLIISIGADLGVPESRCIHLADEYKPENIRLTSDDITVGRARLNRNSKEEYEAEKRLKLSDEPDDGIVEDSFKKIPQPTFSFTRISSCILERIAVAVDQNEPVLLVGETGVGKTSSIQYLAYQTNHKLVVVNMNNQSDVSDLIGGFKPVDIGFIIAPLRIEFEVLFAKTFDLQKNEKFLNNVSICFNRGDFPILVKLMLKIISTVYKRLESQKLTENEGLTQRWQNLEHKLTKLDHQLKNSINLSFAFIPGSLVNCIKNGDWVLLDEINLASTETLECLSTILEPEGSVTLLERGDFVPIKRHPDFRIFSCMNPSTDVGKKDLPVGIRNRFTEFFVDELTSRKDLEIIVGDYLNNTGIQTPRIFKAVKVYMELRKLSQLELNDGLGNKPVFSLRTLCRALRICAKNLCGSIERNIFESFCLSFLTQLDPPSHERVLKLIEKELVSDAKKILSQQIPKPEGNQINFEGYWIELGQKEPEECNEYILTKSVKKNLRDLSRIISIGKLPILLQGPTSAGKTSLIEFIARRSGNYCLRINNHEHTDLQEYIGTYMADVNGKLTFQEGVLVKAMRNGYWIILDELNLAPSDILEALNRVLDDNRELYIPETQVLVKAHPNFMLFATQNPPGLYGGRKTLSRAFKNRFIELHFSEIPKIELEFILEKRCNMAKSHAEKMVKTMSALQANRRTTTKNNFTLRDLFRWGNRYTIADKKLLNDGNSDKNYDWNQHLVDEGYLVLSAKVRNALETEIISDALFQNFRKKISVENLFTLNEKTSLVTKSILEKITSYKGEQNVVWTLEMRRMAVLVSKSLDFNEPVLLVGPTGCGKTTVCQILAEIRQNELRILNCHMHTEGADFLGGLRPHRDSGEDEQKQLFEWADGPLILSMVEGNFFLADEISLAEDSVLERLNCVLEPERTILLAEKGGVDENVVHGATKDSEFVIKASDGFQFLATMNPGGDFGKKELSPALRNRFTEIWCTAINSDEDLVRIAKNSLGISYDQQLTENIAQIIIKTVNVLKHNVEKLNFSIRDVLAWVNYITKNYSAKDNETSILSLNDALLYGLQTLFLDALEMLPYENFEEIQNIRQKIITAMGKFINTSLKLELKSTTKIDELNVESNKETLMFGISPFYLKINASGIIKSNEFSFSAPTTKRNLFRVLSALSLNKAILLEGPPGVGKSSLIENIANAIGYNIVRINLCEHTDLADLFGTDLPAESKSLEIKESNEELQLGSFVWRDGPLLAALKAPDTWILLDELNLAPQSVLEGLNAILDHRGEVYIPELNQTFKLGHQTRIFAAQNPLRQGGGRKGLPQSFLNRFTKVYLRKLNKIDLLHVIRHNFDMLEEIALLKDYKLLDRMVTFSEGIEQGMSNLEFGYKGGPYEANLRDILRWCKLLTNAKTGFNLKLIENDQSLFQDFLLVLFEKMKLVYCQRMRAESDVAAIVNIFGDVFDCNAESLSAESRAISFYWNDTDVFIGDIQWSRAEIDDMNNCSTHKRSIILSSQIEALKNVTECVMLEKPVILNGPSDCGKTKIIDTFCSIFNKNLYLDTIDDSVTGSFQQFDFNRMLEEMWQNVEQILFKKMSNLAIVCATSNDKHNMLNLFHLWRNYDCEIESSNVTSPNSELESFRKRIEAVRAILEALAPITAKEMRAEVRQMQREVDSWRNILEKSSNVLNTGGRFEWVDSVIVKSIKFGHFICLEHVNLASSAILDRLNPIMEPNGTLLISEKGVGKNNEPENIAKHQNFRIFLTMDPKHGEISRAMRNRCIELAISRENYTEDDLRKIIYMEGVRKMYLMEAIMKIHKVAKSLSEFSTFGVSHLTKMSFLVAQNMAMGLDDKKCLRISALEVYVRSSSIDLLGFGLSYYMNMLKEVIIKEIQTVKYQKDYTNYDNFILKSDELTTMKLVKLQSEVLLVVLRCLEQNVSVEEIFRTLSIKFAQHDFKGIQAMPKYLLTFVYMISTFNDNELRKLYLDKMISDDSLKNLNQNLSKIVKEFTTEGMNLPWNSKMIKRLRPYQSCRMQSSDEYRITLALLLEMTLEEINMSNSVKRSDIDVFTYSRAVEKKLLSDTIENTLVTGIYKLLNLFKAFVKNFLGNSNVKIDDPGFVKIVLSLLWFNRVLSVSREKLYKNNSVNTDLIDQLNLHFKWFSKHCVSLLMPVPDTNDDFMKTFQSIQHFILSHHHPLKLYKKIYVKGFTNFVPFYNDHQVKNFRQVSALSNLVRVVPKMDRLYDFDQYQKRLVLMMSSSYRNCRQKFITTAVQRFDVFELFKLCWDEDMRNSDSLCDLINRFECVNSSNSGLLNMEKKIEEFQDFLKRDEAISATSSKFEIEVLPIMEYFVIKMLQAAAKHQLSINIEYLAEVPSIDAYGINVVTIMDDPRFNILRKIALNDSVSKEFTKNYLTLNMQVTCEIQRVLQQSLAVNNMFCHAFKDEENYAFDENQLYINGPLLTRSVFSILLGQNGALRGTGLGEIVEWKTMLKKLKKVLWMNAEANCEEFNMLKNNLHSQLDHASQLLTNVEAVKHSCMSIENENFSDFNNDFWLVINKLKESVHETTLGDDWQRNFIVNSLCGIVELNLITYLPLMDPVKKNQLKTNYLHEDADHLERLLTSYKFMSIIMNYENLGKENRILMEAEIELIQKKLVKYSTKVALRPDDCIYSKLVEDINQFLASCCHPKTLLKLVTEIECVLPFEIDYIDATKNHEAQAAKAQMAELISKLDLWIVNANKFENHTIQKFQAFYRDFVVPIECSITSLKNGFMGLRALLKMKNDAIQKKESGAFWSVNQNNELSSVMKKLIEFPSKLSLDVVGDKSQKVNIFSILERISNSEGIYLKLINAKVQEISNTSAVTEKLAPESFQSYDAILNVCNQMWQKQEELKRKRQADEDSLYVTKTKCAEEDEETVKLREINEIFPNYAEEDFNEFLQNDTLEQIIKPDKETKKVVDIIANDDYKIIGEHFIALMDGKLRASQDYLKVFEDKLRVFHPIFEEFKTCFDNSIDDSAYKSLSLLVALCQESYDDLQLKEPSTRKYNFYMDSNITEAIACVDVMAKLEQKVHVELEQYPEHAVLNDLIRIISRIRGFPSNSPLARFNSGLQILRQKVDEWNQVAHKLNNFRELEYEIAQMIQKWMRMELQCWRESLNQSLENTTGRAYRYWFFLYNLIHEFLSGSGESDKVSSLIDFNDVEKRFASDEVMEEKPTAGKISVEAITKVLKQFIESSSYAEFGLRMKMIKSFENYVVKLNSVAKRSNNTQLISILHNLHMYFSQFDQQVQEQIEFVRKPIEKKLKDAVKIQSFNKDLSYFSMRSDIKKVHRDLHKILKEFQIEVTKKINDLLQYKDSIREFNEFKAPSSVWKPTDLKLETFIASQDLTPLPVTANESSKEILQNIDKYFIKSRKIVLESLENAEYPLLIELFQEMMEKELDTVTHLRCLEVNREQPRNKQKSQAKSILNQKRKALTDFFKSLTSMGVSYKTGLLTNSLNSELTDLQISPFTIDSITSDDIHVHNRIQIVSQKTDLYFNKSMFKMKLLTNALLMPRPDMDHGFLERMKGFAIDFFTLVQEQRKSLSVNVNDISMLRKFLKDLDIVKSAETAAVNFESEFKKLEIVQDGFIKAIEIMEQFKILMKCAPEDAELHHKVISSSNNTFHQKSHLYSKIMLLSEEVLTDLKAAVKVATKSQSRFNTEIDKLVMNFTTITDKLHELKEYFVVEKSYSIYGNAICDLHMMMSVKLLDINSLNKGITQVEDDIDDQLSDLANTILISMQNIFKKFKQDDTTKTPADEEANLVPNHLKEKMHNEIAQDFEILNLHKINLKLQNILDSVFTSTNPRANIILSRILPLIKQFDLLVSYFFVQQLSAHKLSVRMLSIMLSVFLELATKGFCVPQDLLSDEEQKEENDTKTGEGFGFEDGEGEKDVSDKLESEDQLDEAKKPEDYNDKNEQQEKDCKEEKGIDMSEDFEGKMQDVDKNDDSDSDAASDENEEMDKEMGETEEGADKLDDQIWGSDEENEPEEQEDDKNEETGKGSGEKDDKHNDMDTDKNQNDGQEEEGLDAADSNEEKKQQQKKDIEEMNEQGEEEDQVNPYHNELEEPPQPEDLNIDEDINLDNEDKETKENPEENPFDIDSMKENMETSDDQPENEGDGEQDPEEKKDAVDSDNSEDEINEQNETEKPDPNQEINEENQEPEANENEDSPAQVPDTIPEDQKTEEKQQNTSEEAHESKDKKTKEENVQSMPNPQQQGSHDDVEVESSDETAKQETEIDEQDTGEDRDGVGQAENEESKSGHQGIADTKETKSRRNQQNKQQQKRKMGNTDEERTLGEVDKMEKKTLKTVDRLNRQENPDSDQEMDDQQEAEEHQHVKDAKKTDKTTMDNATEEQSKKIQHNERTRPDEDDAMEGTDELMDEDKDPEMLDKKPEELESNKLDKKSDKPARSEVKSKERLEQAEEVQIDGEDVTTFNVPRGDETTAHCQMEIINDNSIPEEQSTAELFALRKMVEAEATSQKVVNPDATDMERWQEISNRMMPNARDLCEQLRLILEPTKCTRLKGDYRTGRRINMKKIIPYIASQFRKDKIWLRRTKPAQRDYKITIAVDDSKSMDHNNSKNLTLQAISLVSQALTLLESGKLCVMSFGESPKIILKYNDQFDGPKMVKSLNFDQNKSRIAELLDFSRTLNQEGSSSDNGIFEHLLIVLSDGRNIFSEGEQKVKNAIKQARLQRMFIVYIIIDNPENKYSILDIRTPQFSADKKTIIAMHSYLDTFPFPYYVIVRDLNQLPLVLSDGLRQWFELVNSEQ